MRYHLHRISLLPKEGVVDRHSLSYTDTHFDKV